MKLLKYVGNIVFFSIVSIAVALVAYTATVLYVIMVFVGALTLANCFGG